MPDPRGSTSSNCPAVSKPQTKLEWHRQPTGPKHPMAASALPTWPSRNVKGKTGSHLTTEQMSTWAFCPMWKQEPEYFPWPTTESLDTFTDSSLSTIIKNFMLRDLCPLFKHFHTKPHSCIPLHDLKKKFPIHVLVRFDVWLVGLSYSHLNLLHKLSSFHAPVECIGALQLREKKQLHEDFNVKRLISLFLYFSSNLDINPPKFCNHLSKIFTN